MSSHDVTETVSSSDPDGESSDMSRSKPKKNTRIIHFKHEFVFSLT